MLFEVEKLVFSFLAMLKEVLFLLIEVLFMLFENQKVPKSLCVTST